MKKCDWFGNCPEEGEERGYVWKACFRLRDKIKSLLTPWRIGGSLGWSVKLPQRYCRDHYLAAHFGLYVFDELECPDERGEKEPVYMSLGYMLSHEVEVTVKKCTWDEM